MIQIAQIVASDDIHTKIKAECPMAYKVKSFSNGVAWQTQADFRAWAKANNLYTESVFERQQGSKSIYKCLVYRNAIERSLAFIC